MGLTISIDKKNFYSLFTMVGKVSFVDLRKELEYMAKHSSFFHRMPMIWDFRHADLAKTSRQQIDKIAAFFDQKTDMLGTIKLACIVATDLQCGLCRMLQFYMDKNIAEIKIFKDYSAAMAWAGEIKFVFHNLPVNLSVSN
jgi:hypothetical protein